MFHSVSKGINCCLPAWPAANSLRQLAIFARPLGFHCGMIATGNHHILIRCATHHTRYRYLVRIAVWRTGAGAPRLPCVKGKRSAVAGVNDSPVDCQSRDRTARRRLSAKLTEGLSFQPRLHQNRRIDNPSVTASPCHLPLHRGGFGWCVKQQLICLPCR